MATPPTLDVDGLLIAVSDEQPAGPALREAADRNLAQLYFAVRDARKKAMEAERRFGDYTSMTEDERKGHGRAPDGPDWGAVERSGIEALRQSKDLWVTAWVIEGVTRTYGFAGLRDGVLLAHGLCERFWDGLHPRATADGDLATRFAQLAGLDGGLSSSATSEGTLIAPIRDTPLTGGMATPFSLADYRDALYLEDQGVDVRRRRVAQGAVTIEVFKQAIVQSGAGFLDNVRADLEAASQALTDFGRFVRSKEQAIVAAGGKPFAPPTTALREEVDACLTLVKASIHEAFPSAASAGAATGTAPGSGAATGMSPGPRAGDDPPDAGPFVSATLATRQDAFAALLRVADYFRRAEPHSPVSYALEQAVRWGRMSLPELLSDLVSDRSTREEIFRRAGIVADPKDKS